MNTRKSSRPKSKASQALKEEPNLGLDANGCVVEDALTPSKKKPKGVSAKSTRSKGTGSTRHRVKGKLRNLPDMPIDILYEVSLRDFA